MQYTPDLQRKAERSQFYDKLGTLIISAQTELLHTRYKQFPVTEQVGARLEYHNTSNNVGKGVYC